MRRALISVFGLCLLFSACGAGHAPKGPYVPLVSRIDVDSDFVFFVDLAALSKSLDKLRDTMKTVPLVAQHPELKNMIEQQLSIVDSSLALVKAMLGFDVLKGFNRAAIGIRLKQSGEDPDVVLVLNGKIPPGVFQKVFPGAKPENKFGEDVWAIPESDFHAALIGGKTLVVCNGDMTEKRLNGGEISKDLLKHHPDLFRNEPEGSYIRMSFFMAPWVVLWAKEAMDKEPTMAMIESLLSIRQVFIDLADQVEVYVECADVQGAQHLKSMMEAQAEMTMGGQHLVRGIVYIAMALDLELLDDLPPAFVQTLADRKAQEQTLDFLFPEPQSDPLVSLDDKKVSLKADLGMLKGFFTLIGLLSSMALPEYFEYQLKAQEAKAEMGMMKKMRQNAPKVNTDGTLMDGTKGKDSVEDKGAKQ